ncbi:hypothetical protein DPM19_00130 [Actinomadura craniellae]|uniref:Luciferase domain-containing protein n=1 Tax=Actinomadura craniellae TaxID=2231787 RepID=A0A365HBY4_9ACTN|nr:luciferase family protein [Actinomadura craniellae]RAY16634.1 hypothetical protein DPM19_00130 [Actinomadura craniellae]
MSGYGRTGTSLANQVITKMIAWPGIRVTGAECGVGRGLIFGTQQIVHLHSGDEAELRLVPEIVTRLRDALEDSGRAVVSPGGAWVTVHLDSESDVTLVLTLASVAIKVQTENAAAARQWSCGVASDPRDRLYRMAAPLPGRWPIRPADLREPSRDPA